MLVGYMRISTDRDRQILDLQRDALLAFRRCLGGRGPRRYLQLWRIISGARHRPYHRTFARGRSRQALAKRMWRPAAVMAGTG